MPKRALFVAVASLFSLFAAASSDAQPRPPGAPTFACTTPPPKPEGHVLGVISKIDARGEATIGFNASLPKNQVPKSGDDIHLLSCDGALKADGRSDVARVSGSDAQARFKSLKDPAKYVGHYVAIDSGYSTATPMGVVEPSVTDTQVDASGVKLTFNGGEEDGVFAGAEGRIELRDKRVVKFTISSATRYASTAQVRLSRDETGTATRILVASKKRRCFAPEPIASTELDAVSKLTSAPRGYVFATGTVSSGIVTVSLGTEARIASSGQAYAFSPSLSTARLEAVSAKQTTLRLGQASSLKSVRVMLPVLPAVGTCTE